MKALTIKERLRLQSNSSVQEPRRSFSKTTQNFIERWKSAEHFHLDTSFSDRISLYNSSFNEIFTAVDISLNYDKGRDIHSLPPQWFEIMEDAYKKHRYAYNISSKYTRATLTRLAVNLIEPLLLDAIESVERRLEHLFEAPNTLLREEDVYGLFIEPILSRLTWNMRRVLVLETNIARLQNEFIEDPIERFKFFIRSFRDRQTAFDLLMDYPVLARQLVLQIGNWREEFCSFLERLHSDREIISATFFSTIELGKLKRIKVSGDTHKNGSSVIVATFSSEQRVVYKPRSLAVDAHFQDLINILNIWAEEKLFLGFKVVNQKNYGWTEFVSQDDCHSKEQIQRFYKRQGNNLALMYAIGGSDINFENIIAAGEYPVIVDVEGLFRPLRSSDLNESLLYESIFGTLLVTSPKGAGEEDNVDDVSGFSNQEGKVSNFELAFIDDVNTDSMQVVRKKRVMEKSANLPNYNNQTEEASSYVSFIADGFRQVYTLIGEHSETLASNGGLLSQFLKDETRILMRHTNEYTLLLDESYHPDVLQDAVFRDEIFDHLWGNTVHLPFLEQVFEAERDDLWNNDVPIFTTIPSSRHLWTSRGERLDNFLPETGMSVIQKRISRFGSQDLERQIWLLELALTRSSTNINTKRKVNSLYVLKETPASPTLPILGANKSKNILAAAALVGDRIIELAWKLNSGTNWFSISVGAENWSLAPMDIFLYEGLSGTAIFFAYLGKITKEQKYLQLAHEATSGLLHQLDRCKYLVSEVGGFMGWGSVIYALTHLSVTLARPDLIARAVEIADLLPPLLNKSKEFDILNGIAGCSLALSALQTVNPSHKMEDLYVLCGKLLVENLITMQKGVAWSSTSNRLPLAGFSHGAAGISISLLKLSELTGNNELLKIARLAIEYERTLFIEGETAWADLRYTDEGGNSRPAQTSDSSWCNGAAGIGLARIRSLKYISDSLVHEEIEKAVANTLLTGFKGNHSLCHGALGNLELIHEANSIFDHKWIKESDTVLTNVLTEVYSYNWKCGAPNSIESSGLMLGLSGIGLGLLRAYNPSIVPSILMLDPPSIKSPV